MKFIIENLKVLLSYVAVRILKILMKFQILGCGENLRVKTNQKHI